MDVGSSNGLERQPTCLFVQVIIRCVTAKAGARGVSAPRVFIYHGKTAEIFRIWMESADFPLETKNKMVYNIAVYAIFA